MEKKHTAFGTYSYAEIIGRLLAKTAAFEGPSCFPVELTFNANNQTSPPVIELIVSSLDRNGRTEVIYNAAIDQNTTLDALDRALDALDKVADRILQAVTEQVPYNSLLEKHTPTVSNEEESDLPF